MLRRLLFSFLVLCLSLPAVAMTGHCAVPDRAPAASCHEMTGHQVPAKAPVQAKDCIGCVTPLAALDGPPMVVAEDSLPVTPRLQEERTLQAVQPDTPPPRS